jgi:hypothetical protein
MADEGEYRMPVEILGSRVRFENHYDQYDGVVYRRAVVECRIPDHVGCKRRRNTNLTNRLCKWFSYQHTYFLPKEHRFRSRYCFGA